MTIKTVILERRKVRSTRQPDDIFTHRTCLRCNGTNKVGLGINNMACQYYGYAKKHRDN